MRYTVTAWRKRTRRSVPCPQRVRSEKDRKTWDGTLEIKFNSSTLRWSLVLEFQITFLVFGLPRLTLVPDVRRKTNQSADTECVQKLKIEHDKKAKGKGN